MSALKLHTLKQKLWAIVAVSFVARLVMFFVLPSTPTSLAPDEGTYALYAKDLSREDLGNIFQKIFDFESLGRTLVIPSSLLIKLGSTSLDAIRAVSSLYGLISLVLLILTIQ